MVSVGDDAALISAAVRGASLSEIAAAAGVSISTVQRRLRDGDIAAAIREARLQARRETVGQALSLRTAALTKAGELLHSEDAAVALRAASLLLSSASRIEAAYDFSERLSALEADRDGPALEDGQPNDPGFGPGAAEPGPLRAALASGD